MCDCISSKMPADKRAAGRRSACASPTPRPSRAATCSIRPLPCRRSRSRGLPDAVVIAQAFVHVNCRGLFLPRFERLPCSGRGALFSFLVYPGRMLGRPDTRALAVRFRAALAGGLKQSLLDLSDRRLVEKKSIRLRLAAGMTIRPCCASGRIRRPSRVAGGRFLRVGLRSAGRSPKPASRWPRSTKASHLELLQARCSKAQRRRCDTGILRWATSRLRRRSATTSMPATSTGS